MRVGIYAGSFDPITFGHLDVIDRAMELFDKVVIAVGVNADKKTLFSISERLEAIHDAIEKDAWFYQKRSECEIEIISYENKYLFQLAKEYQNSSLIRGIRNAKDFEYELALENFNREHYPNLKTVYLSATPKKVSISSSFVKSLIGYQGWEYLAEQYVTPFVLEKLKEKYAARNS